MIPYFTNVLVILIDTLMGVGNTKNCLDLKVSDRSLRVKFQSTTNFYDGSSIIIVLGSLLRWLTNPYQHIKPLPYKHSYDILGAGMLWKPKDLHKIR
jgi:hypothetical protein